MIVITGRPVGLPTAMAEPTVLEPLRLVSGRLLTIAQPLPLRVAWTPASPRLQHPVATNRSAATQGDTQ